MCLSLPRDPSCCCGSRLARESDSQRLDGCDLTQADSVVCAGLVGSCCGLSL